MQLSFLDGLLVMAGIGGMVFFCTRWAIYGADNKGRKRKRHPKD